MNIELIDNKDGSFILTDKDRGILVNASLITPNYKGGNKVAIYDLDASAKVYTSEDITKTKSDLRQVIDDAQSKLDEIMAIENQTK